MRLIETPEYWQSDFAIGEDDINYLYETLVEAGVPRSTEQLAGALIEYRQRVEAESAAAQLRAQGTIYQPKKTYSVGERVLFPKLDNASGVIAAVRAGENPDYGDFDVIRVDMGDDGVREFAARFSHPHPLNEEQVQTPARDLVALHAGQVAEILEPALQKQPEFVSVDDQWLLADMMPDVHVGYLNIAEAVIDLAEAPVPTPELLKQVDLPADVPPATQEFALNYALARDPRFSNVGDEHHPVWALARQESPEGVSS